MSNEQLFMRITVEELADYKKASYIAGCGAGAVGMALGILFVYLVFIY